MNFRAEHQTIERPDGSREHKTVLEGQTGGLVELILACMTIATIIGVSWLLLKPPSDYNQGFEDTHNDFRTQSQYRQ
ncbi:hypothetical protein [aff. Roholtiella sp. LEGE 12411]|uniref:hypothetical protein n=1 Tax=aff. Roholtiella sp. LEGE 12411 TaxID=1828822 RepID=UPI00187ED4F8|nr:hypothetical protein [aff. Roholtiella sp. LEGE 12411]MBE9037004.1 hypothetical protein [aff. Roholtiella sp. LEGE 12411]